jgi:hypothetical protein
LVVQVETEDSPIVYREMKEPCVACVHHRGVQLGLLTRREWHRKFSLLLEIISKEPIETEVPIRLMSSG